MDKVNLKLIAAVAQAFALGKRPLDAAIAAWELSHDGLRTGLSAALLKLVDEGALKGTVAADAQGNREVLAITGVGHAHAAMREQGPVAAPIAIQRDVVRSPDVQPNSEALHARYQMAPTVGGVDPTLCFVIMSFANPKLNDFYDHAVKPTIEKLGYRCERVDEQQYNDSIRERIIANIDAARFIVADVSESRPNCYYELGIAHALGKEVIHLANSSTDIHFDVKDFNFIIYSRISDLQAKLEHRISATVGSAVATEKKA